MSGLNDGGYIFFCLRTYSIPAIDQRNPRPGQTQHHLQPGTAEMRGGLTEEQRRRLGLHRPGVMMIFCLH